MHERERNHGQRAGNTGPTTTSTADFTLSSRCRTAWEELAETFDPSSNNPLQLFGTINSNVCADLDEWTFGALSVVSPGFFDNVEPARLANVNCRAASADAYDVLTVCQDAAREDPAGAP